MKTSRVPGSGFCSHRVITYMQQNPCHKVTMDNVLTSQTGARAASLQLCPTLCDPVDQGARQAPLSMGFSRQEYWGRLPCPPPGDLPYPGIEPASLTSPALAGGFFTTSAT